MFKFRGLLGQGSYGVVMIVQDKILCSQKDYQSTSNDGSKMNGSFFETQKSAKDQEGKCQLENEHSKPRETYALKIINKSVLNSQEISALKGEATIMRDMVGRSNVVQFLNIFETDKFIIIQMEHLKGSNMKRDLNAKISEKQEQMLIRYRNQSFYNKKRGSC